MLKFNILTTRQASGKISEVDDYIRHTTLNYRSLFSNGKEDDFCKVLSESVVEPSRENISIIRQSEIDINFALKSLGLNINKSINFIFTNGTDNVGLPYTKGDSIVMPVDYHFPSSKLGYLNDHLISHEIWHILSRGNSILRDMAYKAIGFKKSATPLNLSKLEDYFINPDALCHDYYFPYKNEDIEYKLFPVLCSEKETTFEMKPYLVNVKKGDEGDFFWRCCIKINII